MSQRNKICEDLQLPQQRYDLSIQPKLFEKSDIAELVNRCVNIRNEEMEVIKTGKIKEKRGRVELHCAVQEKRA